MRKEREQLINLVKLQAKEMEVLLPPLCLTVCLFNLRLTAACCRH
jgi:hypothetical protein